MKHAYLPLLALSLVFGLTCTSSRGTLDHAPPAETVRPTPQSPAGVFGGDPGDGPSIAPGASSTYRARGPVRVDLRDLPVAVPLPPGSPEGRVAPPPGRKLSDADLARLQMEAYALPPDDDIQTLPYGPGPIAPIPGVGFPGIDYLGAASGLTPPDPELAVGRTHIIEVVNSAFQIYDKTGVSVFGPITFGAFMAADPACAGFLFDPNVAYDEAADRYIVAIDANPSYCIAVSATPGGIVAWNLYSFTTAVAGATLFDYPHIGVGWNGIYLGSNQYAGPSYLEGRVWFLDKAAMYGGGTLTTVTHSTGADGTPWPANFHGANDGTFPTSGPHWIMTEVYDGCNHNVWTWIDPLGANVFTRGANLDLCLFTGVSPGLPIPGPQLAGMDIYDIVDWRGQSTEYRNGSLWMANQGQACNPGGGVVDCIRWAEIDPLANVILQAGILASPDVYRAYPSLAVNRCNDMAIGYTATGPAFWPEIRLTGREVGDPPNVLQPETLVKLGEQTFSCYDAPAPLRWGDYTGLTPDPDGVRFWYLGEYSKTMAGMPSCDWGTFIGSFTYQCPIFSDGFESGDVSAWTGSVP